MTDFKVGNKTIDEECDAERESADDAYTCKYCVAAAASQRESCSPKRGGQITGKKPIFPFRQGHFSRMRRFIPRQI